MQAYFLACINRMLLQKITHVYELLVIYLLIRCVRWTKSAGIKYTGT